MAVAADSLGNGHIFVVGATSADAVKLVPLRGANRCGIAVDSDISCILVADAGFAWNGSSLLKSHVLLIQDGRVPIFNQRHNL